MGDFCSLIFNRLFYGLGPPVCPGCRLVSLEEPPGVGVEEVPEGLPGTEEPTELLFPEAPGPLFT